MPYSEYKEEFWNDLDFNSIFEMEYIISYMFTRYCTGYFYLEYFEMTVPNWKCLSINKYSSLTNSMTYVWIDVQVVLYGLKRYLNGPKVGFEIP